MIRPTILASGAGGATGRGSGPLRRWEGIGSTQDLKGSIVYVDGPLPLFAAALLVELQPAGVVIAEGGRNYHPLILLGDARVPAIAGVGSLSLGEGTVTVDSTAGVLLEGEVPETTAVVSPPADPGQVPVYVNVGYPSALEAAARTGAMGIGLLRTEFSGVRALARHLGVYTSDGETLRELVGRTSEADGIYRMTTDPELQPILREEWASTLHRAIEAFGDRTVIVRTLDIARDLDDPMGNRGVRRCVAEGSQAMVLLGEAIRDALESSPDGADVGVILPLVSHYGQIAAAQQAMEVAGLTTSGATADRRGIRFGWEVEQPAAALNNDVWLRAYAELHGHGPHMIGIGTNDLTQFTIALGRDAAAQEEDDGIRSYLESLYDELDVSVVRQIRTVARQAASYDTEVFLLGQAAARPQVARLMIAFGVIPSVGLDKVAEVRALASEFSRESSGSAIEDYCQEVSRTYPEDCREAVYSLLVQELG